MIRFRLTLQLGASALLALMLGSGVASASGGDPTSPATGTAGHGSNAAAPPPEQPDGASLSELIEAYVRSRATQPISAIDVPKLSQFELDGEFDLSISSHPDQPMSGWVPLTLTLSEGGEVRRSGVVTVRVASPREVVVARRQLARGAIVEREDLTTELREASKVPPDALADAGFAVGKRMRRSVSGNRTLRERDVEVPPVVQRGDPVKLVLEQGRLRLDTAGRALEDGRPGEWIRVRSAAARRDIEGRVGANGIVYVGF